MWKYVTFAGCFLLVFIILQVLSGMLLTMFYEPDMSWANASALPSKVTLTDSNTLLPVLIAIVAGMVAFWATKLINKS